MSNRFVHDQFNIPVVCPHCQGSGERKLHADGHFSYNESFVLESLTDENGKEIIPTDAEREAIETKGDSRFPMVQQEAREYAYARAKEIQNLI